MSASSADPASRTTDPGARRIAVLISGRGSNLQALIDAIQEGRLDARIAVVISNNANAQGLDRARAAGIETLTIDHRTFPTRDAFDAEIARQLKARGVALICLAGFMRILSPWFVAKWRGRIINVHPSLLPKYRGLDTHARALAAGDSSAGCSVHLVTEELDAGEVLGRAEVPILFGDTPQSLESRVLAAEHALYPKVLSEFVRR